MNKSFLILIFFLLSALQSNAIAGNGTSTGMQFLLMGPSAHNMGISDGHVASKTGASAIFLNPSMLAMENQSSATLSYMLWPVTDTQNSFAGVAFRREKDAFGFAILSSFIDDIPFRTGPTSNPDLFAVRYLSLAGSYARNYGPLSLGVTGMYLYEQFFQQDALGYGMNAGIGLNVLDERVRLGTSLRNLGSMNDLAETATKLPTILSFGSEMKLMQFSTSATQDEIPLLVSLVTDYNVPLNEIRESDDTINSQDEGYFNVGLELNISEIIDLRSGFRSGDTQRRFSFGAGLLINEFYFNYAFMPFNTGFGTAHAVSIQYMF